MFCESIRFPRLVDVFPARARPYLVLSAAVLIHLTLGTIYCIGNLLPYIASYLRFVKHQDQSIGSMSWFGSLTSASQGAFMFVGGIIEKFFGTRVAILTGCTLAVTGVATTYFSIQAGAAGGYVTYGVIFGSGVGIAYAPCIACAMRWLPDRKGLVTGCVVAGFGLGAFVFNYVATFFVNPKNLVAKREIDGFMYFDESQQDVLDRTPYVFLVLAACYAGIQLIGLLFICNPEQNAEKIPIVAEVESFTPVEMLKTQTFYCIWLMFFLNAAAISFVGSYYKVFGELFITNDHFLSSTGSVASVANAMGRIFWGHIGDRYSYQVTIASVSAIFAFLMFSFEACSRAGEAMFFIWVVAIFFTFSGNFVLHPMATAKVFGRGHFATNYGIVFTSGLCSSLIMAGMATGLLKYLHFYGFFLLLGALLTISFLIASVVHKTDRGRPHAMMENKSESSEP